MVDSKGHLYTFGCPENGVLGSINNLQNYNTLTVDIIYYVCTRFSFSNAHFFISFHFQTHFLFTISLVYHSLIKATTPMASTLLKETKCLTIVRLVLVPSVSSLIKIPEMPVKSPQYPMSALSVSLVGLITWLDTNFYLYLTCYSLFILVLLFLLYISPAFPTLY